MHWLGFWWPSAKPTRVRIPTKFFDKAFGGSMRAEIEIKEFVEKVKTGWLSSENVTHYQVYPHVTFTNEEKAILTQFRLWDRIAYVFTRDIADVPAHLQEEMKGQLDSPLSIKKIAEPNFFLGFSDPVEARQMADVFADEILPKIKAFLTEVAKPSEKRIVEL
jgi:hypothetical protein